MAIVTLTPTEISLRSLVGTPALLRGRALVNTGKVTSVQADLNRGRIDALVLEGERPHDVCVLVSYGRDGQVVGLEGGCTCGLDLPCPHAVAALLAAGTDDAGPTVANSPAVVATTVQPARILAPWEIALTSALTDRPAPARQERSRSRTPRPGTAEHALPPIALQFELTDDPRGKIAMRPVVPGRGGGWVRSGVSWSNLQYGYAEYHFSSVPPEQVRLLQELRTLPTATPSYYVDRVILLDAIVSRRVWDLLLEAQELGLPLVMSGRRAEPVVVHAAPAVATLDVLRHDGELVITPTISVAGRALTDCMILGDPGHGVACPIPGGGASGSLALARLAAPPPPLFTRLVGGPPLTVPAADEPRFIEEFYPQLAQHVEIVSRDGSVELPTAAPPVLALAVAAGAGHRLSLTWSWSYAVGTARRSEPLLPAAELLVGGQGAARPPGGGRDLAAEADLLADVLPLLAGHPHLVESSPSGERLRPRSELDGVDTARFMAEALPRLEAHPAVEVLLTRVTDLPDYRQSDDVPVITFAADPGEEQPAGPAQQDWFDLAVTVTVDDHLVPFGALFLALAQGEPALLLDNGVYFSLDRPEFARLAQLIAESRDLLDAPPATVRLNRFHAALWDDVERLGEITGQVDAWRHAIQSLAGLADATDLPDHKVPAGLQATLRPYQQAGFGWLATLFDLRLGGVLADDMGLGKTLQALSLMVHAREQGLTDAPFLVVAPTSVVSNWASEAQRFAPDLTVAAISATAARRGNDLATAVAGADLVITSYTLFRLEFDEYRARSWAGLVLDEAQNVKNHQSEGFRCARELPAEFKLAITGTPMENNLMELWALLSITAPGLFPRADRFTQFYRTPIEREQDTARLGLLRSRISPLMLRRTKEQVAPDLPDRQEQVVELELNPRHRALYAKYLQRERQKVLGLLGDFNRNRFEIFRSLTLLRQLSLDPSLIDPQHAGVPSTKLDALLEHLQDIVAEGHRVLVFSQFTRFLGQARDRLATAGIGHCYLDGTTRNRAKVISEFRTGDAPVFLISLKAGGAGLNLTEADYVILLDPWWNPATEAQAVDRTHRIGQTRKVMVYRLVAKDTIEEKVMALKERKAALTSSVLSGDDFASAAITPDDIRGLLG